MQEFVDEMERKIDQAVEKFFAWLSVFIPKFQLTPSGELRHTIEKFLSRNGMIPSGCELFWSGFGHLYTTPWRYFETRSHLWWVRTLGKIYKWMWIGGLAAIGALGLIGIIDMMLSVGLLLFILALTSMVVIGIPITFTLIHACRHGSHYLCPIRFKIENGQ